MVLTILVLANRVDLERRPLNGVCVGMLPKRGVDTASCELVRFYKMHAQKDVCEPISMIAPRKVSKRHE